MSGFATSDAATMSRIVYESGFNADRPVSNVTPRSTTGVLASVKRIGVGGAALGIDPRPYAGPGTFVDSIIDTVVIGIFGATSRVDFGVLDRVGTRIQTVIDGVPIGVARATSGIDDCARRRSGARILLIGDAVQIGVAEGAGAREDRQAGRADDVARPIVSGKTAAGGVN